MISRRRRLGSPNPNPHTLESWIATMLTRFGSRSNAHDHLHHRGWGPRARERLAGATLGLASSDAVCCSGTFESAVEALTFLGDHGLNPHLFLHPARRMVLDSAAETSAISRARS